MWIKSNLKKEVASSFFILIQLLLFIFLEITEQRLELPLQTPISETNSSIDLPAIKEILLSLEQHVLFSILSGDVVPSFMKSKYYKEFLKLEKV